VICGISDVGINVTISFVCNKKPTSKNVKKIKEMLEKTKDAKELKNYFVRVEFLKSELIDEVNK